MARGSLDLLCIVVNHILRVYKKLLGEWMTEFIWLGALRVFVVYPSYPTIQKGPHDTPIPHSDKLLEYLPSDPMPFG